MGLLARDGSGRGNRFGQAPTGHSSPVRDPAPVLGVREGADAQRALGKDHDVGPVSRGSGHELDETRHVAHLGAVGDLCLCARAPGEAGDGFGPGTPHARVIERTAARAVSPDRLCYGRAVRIRGVVVSGEGCDHTGIRGYDTRGRGGARQPAGKQHDHGVPPRSYPHLQLVELGTRQSLVSLPQVCWRVKEYAVKYR